MLFGGVFLFEESVPIDDFGKISPDVQTFLNLLLFLVIGRSLIGKLVDATTSLEKVGKDGHVLVGLIWILLVGLVVRFWLGVGI